MTVNDTSHINYIYISVSSVYINLDISTDSSVCLYWIVMVQPLIWDIYITDMTVNDLSK